MLNVDLRSTLLSFNRNVNLLTVNSQRFAATGRSKSLTAGCRNRGIGLYRFPSGRLCCPSGLCHFLFQLGSISIRHTPAAALLALTEDFHLTVFARSGVIRVLEGAEQERDMGISLHI